MITLLVFAFIAGIVTTLSPCILPVLPLLLAAGVGQGKYRPHAIVVGLIASFTFFTLALTALIHATGISPNSLRFVSIGLIIFFGLTMIFPQLELLFERFTSPIARLGSRAENASASQTGITSGLILGAALGLVWTPCAGPILAAITALAATGTVTFTAVLVTFMYSVGTALPMFCIMYGGTKISSSIGSITPYTQLIRKIFGVIMILGALAIAFHADVLLQQIAARYIGAITIEDNPLVQKELETFHKEAGMSNSAPVVGGKAPGFVGIAAWINSAPLTIEQLAGNVVLVDFWTYSCINCVRTLPHLKQWYKEYKDKGFVIVGVHTPEFAFERDVKNVQDLVKKFGITYPVALDNAYGTWQNYHNRYWPAHYLVDQQGIIRSIHFGEGAYDETENEIRSLLGMAPRTMQRKQAQAIEQTPEIYLGYGRGDHYASDLTIQRDIITDYNYTKYLADDEIGLQGSWLIAAESITAQNNTARLSINFKAQHVYLVMSAEKPSLVNIYVDNKPIASKNYTKDMNQNGQIEVKEPRMYTVLDLEHNERHTLTLEVPNKVSLFAFTFGTD